MRRDVDRSREAGARPPWRGPLAAALALGLNLALLVAFHDRFWWPPDEGNYAHVAERILDGEVLNGDIQDVHLGHINFLNAGAMALFGRRMVSLRYPLVAVSLLGCWLAFLLLRRGGPAAALTGSLAVTCLGVLQFLDPTAHWYCLALFFLTAWLLGRLPRGHRLRPPLVGCAVATTFAFRQLSGVLLAMGALTWLLLEAGQGEKGAGEEAPGALPRLLALVMAAGLAAYLWGVADGTGLLLFGLWPLAVLALAAFFPRRSDRETLRLLAGLAGGGAAALLPLLLYHLHHGSLGSWLEDTVLAAFRLSQASFIPQSSYGEALGGGALTLLAGPGAAARMSGLFWLLLPWAAALVGILVLYRLWRTRRGKGGPGLSPLALLAVFYAVVSLHYQIPPYLAFTVGASLAALLDLVGDLGRGPRRLALAAVALLNAAGLAFHAGQPISRGWEGRWKGERLPLVASTAQLPRCGLAIEAADLAEYRRLVRLIHAETAPGEPIFAVPSNAELYFLAERPNPTRFFNFALGVRGRAEMEELAARLSARPPRLLFYDPEDKYTTPLARELMAALLPAYEPAGKIGRLEVYRWREAPRELHPPPPSP